jgi:hypothetical protein
LDQFYGSFFQSNVSDGDVNAAQDEARRGDTSIAVEVQKRNQQIVSRNWGDHGAIMGRIQEIDRRDRKLDGKSVEGRGSLFGVQTAIT